MPIRALVKRARADVLTVAQHVSPCLQKEFMGDNYDGEPNPISVSQHIIPCLRQCAPIHIERAWSEKRPRNGAAYRI